MSYRTKDDCLREAERLGIPGYKSMNWRELQSAVAEAVRKEGKAQHAAESTIPGNKYDKYRGYKINIAPEIKPNALRHIPYVEVLGHERITEDVSYLNDGTVNYDSGHPISRDGGEGLLGGTRTIRETSKLVRGHSAAPKENAGIVFDMDKDWFPRVFYKGHVGYLYTHHRLPNFKGMLLEMGEYEKYRKRLSNNNGDVFYACGLLCIKIPVAHQIMREITLEKQAQAERGF